MAGLLDLKDKKLLTVLDENSRLSNSQIARRIGLSKPAVEYRLRRLKDNNIIFQFYTIVDFTRLGYSQYKIYFKFQDITLDDEQNIIDYWKIDPNSIWVAQIRGRWDLAVSILSRSNFEFGMILKRFMNRYSRFILAKDILLLEYSPIYAREYLTETEPSEFLYGVPSYGYSLDGSEKNILKEISTNSRISIVDLAQRSGLSRDVINYRMKKLEKQKVIFQYRCYLNLQNIGISHHKMIFRTKNLDEKREKEIRSYVEAHKKATQLLKLIGSWDLEIEFETENEDELYNILTDIRKRFSSVIRDFDILRINRTYKLDFYPF